MARLPGLFPNGGFQVINISVKIDSPRVKHILHIIKGTDAKLGFCLQNIGLGYIYVNTLQL